MSKKVLFTISILTFSISINASASYTLEELAALSSGTSTGYKIAAQGAINSGGFDPWAASQGGNSEIYKNRIDPAAPNTLQAIANVKNTLAGNAGNSLLQDANNRVTALQTQIAQRNATIQTGINSLDPTQGTLPLAVTSVKVVYGTGPGTTLLQDANNSVTAFQTQIAQRNATINTAIIALDTTIGQTLPGATQAVNDAVSTVAVNRGADVLADVIAARDVLPGGGDLKARALAVQGTINNAIASIDPTQGTLPAAITSVKGVYGTGVGTTLLQDANDSVAAYQGTINTAITALDTTVGQTLPGATQAVNDAVSTVAVNRGADVLADVVAARDALPNSGTGDLKARALAVGGTINTAIVALDTTVGQTLPGATQAVNDAVSTVAVNRGADVLADVIAARNALPGGGDLKARALAVGGTISSAIASIDPTKTTLQTAVTSVLDTPANYTLARGYAQSANANYVSGTTTDASLRNEIIILFNILQTINNSGFQIIHIEDNLLATNTNVTLADIINFLKARANLT